MREQKLDTKTVKLYEDIDELPIKLYNLFNEYGLLDSEIGSDMLSIDRRFQKLHTFLISKKTDEALNEATNLHQTFFNILQHTNFQSLQYGSMINTIDEKPISDYSQSSIAKIMGELSDDGLTQGMVREFVASVKKKSQDNYN